MGKSAWRTKPRLLALWLVSIKRNRPIKRTIWGNRFHMRERFFNDIFLYSINIWNWKLSAENYRLFFFPLGFRLFQFKVCCQYQMQWNNVRQESQVLVITVTNHNVLQSDAKNMWLNIFWTRNFLASRQRVFEVTGGKKILINNTGLVISRLQSILPKRGKYDYQSWSGMFCWDEISKKPPLFCKVRIFHGNFSVWKTDFDKK